MNNRVIDNREYGGFLYRLDNKPRVMYFYSNSCGACVRYSPLFDKQAKYLKNVTINKYELSEGNNRDIMNNITQGRVSTIPCVVIQYPNGNLGFLDINERNNIAQFI